MESTVKQVSFVALCAFAVSSCANAPTYISPTDDSFPALELINAEPIQGIAGVHYDPGNVCVSGTQLVPAERRERKINIRLTPEQEHSFGVMAPVSFSVSGGGGGSSRTASFKTCNSYFSFTPELGYDYRYMTGVEGGACSATLERTQSGMGNWFAAPYKKLELVIGHGCK
jgi:hypothetical protein